MYLPPGGGIAPPGHGQHRPGQRLRSATAIGAVLLLAGAGGVQTYIQHVGRRTAPSTEVAAWAPPPEGYFALLPPGSFDRLPNDAQSAAMVHKSTWEIRPQNRPFNQTRPVNLRLTPVDSRSRAYSPQWNRFIVSRVSGDFSGTTDEIIQWAAAKWGLPDEVVRTVAVMESDWYQDNAGDVAPPGKCPYPSADDCPVSFGIVGVNSRSFQGIYPWNQRSTATNVDMLGGWLRGCYEGWVQWLGDHGNTSRGRYHGGDLWGCVGAWFSGNWYDGQVGRRSAVDYLTRAKGWYAAKPWLRPNY